MEEKVQVQVLGCSGGIGAGLKTTCLRVNETILIDAGTGLESLDLEAMLGLRHLFITHAHLDHICCLPLMMSTLYDRMRQPLQVHASRSVIDALRQHIFNWTIWPDYTQLPTPETSLLRFEELSPGQQLTLDGLTISALAVNHPTPTQGYLLEDADGAIAFSGDTASSPSFLSTLAAVNDLQHLLMDVSFPSDQQPIADASGHYTPAALKRDLDRWPADRPLPQLHISHLKPGFETAVMDECQQLFGHWSVQRLACGDLLTCR